MRRAGALALLGHPARAVVAGFAVAVLAGTAVLSLPMAAEGPGRASLGTALFTATSAITVTGHVVVDTATHWSPAGQVVILVLIQLGGLGIMTSTALLFLLVAGRLGLRQRLVAMTETSAADMGTLRRVLVGVILFSAIFEALTALALTARLWIGLDRPLADALWQGAFHGVSAFNNAGFTLYSDNLIAFATDGWVLGAVAAAVIAGGLGFPVWIELRARARTPSRWSLHTKLTLAATAALLALGTVTLTAMEWDNRATIGAAGAPGRLLGGFFMSVTSRTAGFNAIDYGQAQGESLLVTDMLMFAGGGSASTAGGLKVTTLALLFLVAWAQLRGGAETALFRRAIPPQAQRQAFTVAVLAINAVVLGTLVLLATSPFTLSQTLFECISAFSTVGLSTGITPELGSVGRGVLVVLMFAGRVGPVTLFVALVLRERAVRYARPQESPLVG